MNTDRTHLNLCESVCICGCIQEPPWLRRFTLLANSYQADAVVFIFLLATLIRAKAISMYVRDNALHIGDIKAERLAQRYGTPLYVYDEDVIRRRCTEFVRSIPYEKLKVYYAAKANTNLHILRIMRRLGAGLETVSPGEVLTGFRAGFKSDQILFTCSNIADEELRFLIQNRIMANLDSLNQLEKWGRLNPGSRMAVRINCGIGVGHHEHVVTGGHESKFGIYCAEVATAKRIAQAHRLKIVGVQQHIGSNILDHCALIEAAKALLEVARQFDGLDYVDFGGGFGVPYKPGEKRLRLRRFGREATALFNRFCEDYGKKLTMVFEPGRYLVAEAGVLLARITDIKTTPSKKFVGVDSGFHHLARPALYGSYHPIVNASRVRGKREVVSIAGNLCEAGDLFARDRAITRPTVGALIAILNAGAYGFSMSSTYNSRPRPAEVLVSGCRSRLIRPRESWDALCNR